MEMSKQDYRQAKRIEPIGEAGIEKCRVILNTGYAKVNEVMVDTFSAGAIIAVYDRLNDENKAKFRALPVVRAASVSFKLCK